LQNVDDDLICSLDLINVSRPKRPRPKSAVTETISPKRLTPKRPNQIGQTEKSWTRMFRLEMERLSSFHMYKREAGVWM